MFCNSVLCLVLVFLVLCFRFVPIGHRTKAIEGHLRPYNVRDATLVSQSKLLLARAIMCVVQLQNICKGSFYIYSLAGTI